VPDAGGPPAEQLRAFIAAIAGHATRRPHFPPIWLRELAEGGRHLDPSVLALMQRVLRVLASILTAGRREGLFRPVPPLLPQMGIGGPLLLFTAAIPLRKRWRGPAPFPGEGLTPDAAVKYVQEASLAAIAMPRIHRSRMPRRRS
jgi:hypothetical protein